MRSDPAEDWKFDVYVWYASVISLGVTVLSSLYFVSGIHRGYSDFYVTLWVTLGWLAQLAGLFFGVVIPIIVKAVRKRLMLSVMCWWLFAAACIGMVAEAVAVWRIPGAPTC